MKVLVIGSGGREHALVWKIAQSKKVSKIFCAPGNPGIEEIATCIPIQSNEFFRLIDFVEENGIDLTIVGPEQPLADGIVDVFRDRGHRIFGPTKLASQLEWSKAFAKEFMERHNIPTASYRKFSDGECDIAIEFIESLSLPIVVKADGLSAGKGVIICQSKDEARRCLNEMMNDSSFGTAGTTVVIEEYLRGEEASIFAICDGTHYVTLAPAQDHKRVFDNDQGKNTGGMGAYAPTPLVTPELMQVIQKNIIEPTLEGMAKEERPYTGCLYVGVMITKDGPKVVEFNCRFGDPETQVVLPLFEGDIVKLFDAACLGSIGTSVSKNMGEASKGFAVCVILASGGYPGKYETGRIISGIDIASDVYGVQVFHAATKKSEDGLLTAGGRVLGVTSCSLNASLPESISIAYEAVKKISFIGMHYRTDIGKKALVN